MADREIKIIANTQVRGQAALSGALSDIERKLKALIGQAGQANQAFQKLLGPGRPGVAGLLGTGNNQDATKPIKQLGQAHQDTTNKILKNNRDLVKSYQDLAKAQALAGFGGGEQGLVKYGAMSRFQGSSRTRAFADVSGLLGPAQGIGRYQGGALEPDQVFPGPGRSFGGQRLLGPDYGGGMGGPPFNGGGGGSGSDPESNKFKRDVALSRRLGFGAAIADLGVNTLSAVESYRTAPAVNLAKSRGADSEILSEIMQGGFSPRVLLMMKNQKVKDAIQKDAADAFPGERIGKEVAGVVSSTLKGAGAGAMTGTMAGSVLGPGAGITAGIGAGIGGIGAAANALPNAALNIASGKTSLDEAMTQNQMAMAQLMQRPMFQAAMSQAMSEAPMRAASRRNGRGFETTEAFGGGFSFEESTGLEQSLQRSVGLAAFGQTGLAKGGTRLNMMGLDMGAAQGGLSNVFGALGGKAGDVAKTQKTLEDAVAKGTQRGFSDPRSTEELVSAMSRASQGRFRDQQGFDSLTDFMSLGVKGPVSVIEAQARGNALEALGSVSSNPLMQMQTMGTIEKMMPGVNWMKKKIGTEASPTDLLMGSQALTDAGYSKEERFGLFKEMLPQMPKMGAYALGLGDKKLSPGEMRLSLGQIGIKDEHMQDAITKMLGDLDSLGKTPTTTDLDSVSKRLIDQGTSTGSQLVDSAQGAKNQVRKVGDQDIGSNIGLLVKNMSELITAIQGRETDAELAKGDMGTILGKFDFDDTGALRVTEAKPQQKQQLPPLYPRGNMK